MKKGRKRAFTGFGILLTFVLAFAIFFYFNFKTVQVSGVSMLPTLTDGRKVLVSKAYWLIGPIKKKDIVVIRDDNPSGFIIKRVHYMPGETVDWKWVPDGTKLSGGPYVVPNGQIYVMGDNKPQSDDSRHFGPVNLSDVLGKVVVWP